MRHLFVGKRMSIKCHNQYNTLFETGMIILLYRMSHPRHLHPDMKHELKMRKSKLSSIIHTFSAALYQFTTAYLNNVTLWLHQMPHYAMLINQNMVGLIDCVWGFVDGTIRMMARPLYHQRSIYTHFQKCHYVKFQSKTVSEGFTINHHIQNYARQILPGLHDLTMSSIPRFFAN